MKLLTFILCWLITSSGIAAVEKKSGFKVGDVKQSILTEAQFQSQHGSEWVKIRGQLITGSKLCVKFSICTLPNAEGRFLRDSVADASLGSTQEQDTKLNNITGYVPSSEFGHTHSNGTIAVNAYDYGTGSFSSTVNKNQWNNDQISHAHSVNTAYTDPPNYSLIGRGGTYGGQITSTNVSKATWNSVNAYAYISKSTFDHGHTLSGSSVATYTKPSNANITFENDGAETRPNSLVVNTFIKIN